VRHAVFIVVLVGAAFLGGAVVNGPGAQWAQSRILRSLHLQNEGEIDAVDFKSNANSEFGSGPGEVGKPRSGMSQGPIAPEPSIRAPDEPSEQQLPDPHSPPKPRDHSSENRSGSNQIPQSSLPSVESPRSITKSPSGNPSGSQRDSAPAHHDSSSETTHFAQPGKSGPELVLPDTLIPQSQPSNSSSDRFRSLGPDRSTGSISTPARNPEWAVLESRMQSVGVSRFIMEGKPGGPIVFTCLVPKAGEQAVTERIEAEGDSVIQAAQTALRRIILWRAAQAERRDQAGSNR
jgi:hypothetical protein